MVDLSIPAAIGGAVLGGGGVAAWRKAGPEAESVVIQTMTGVLAELRLELDRKDNELAVLLERLDILRSRLDEAQDLLEKISASAGEQLGTTPRSHPEPST